MTVPNLILYFLILLVVQSNYKTLYEENFEHNYKTPYKNDFQYPNHCLHLVDKTTTHMGK